MQDLLVYVTKGISAVTTALRQEGKQVSAEINHLITLNLFTTITNANGMALAIGKKKPQLSVFFLLKTRISVLCEN